MNNIIMHSSANEWVVNVYWLLIIGHLLFISGNFSILSYFRFHGAFILMLQKLLRIFGGELASTKPILAASFNSSQQFVRQQASCYGIFERILTLGTFGLSVEDT